MDELEGGYAGIPAQIFELGAKLQAHPDPDGEIAEDVQRLLELVEEFHRLGLTRLVEMIEQWRGEIFLASATQDSIVGTLLGAYALPRTE